MGYLPEVVRIIAAHVDGGGGKAIGTGFFMAVDGVHIQEEGLILTNAHVVTGSPVVKIMTTYIEHQALPVTVVAVCHDHDLALLKVEPSVHQWLKRTLLARYKLDHVPSFAFADSNRLRTGYEVNAVGYPLGLMDQQFTTGLYQGCVHLNGEIRGLSGALINGGNSGGPLLGTVLDHQGVAVVGLHYFQPTKYEVMGVNTFKLTGANVDGENGFITSNMVQLALPMLVTPLKQRHVAEEAMQKMVIKMVAAGGSPTAQPVLRALSNHLTDQECQLLHTKMGSIELAWKDHVLGGRVNQQARGFHNWIWRHVVAPQRHHLHHGGPELLSKVLSFVETDNWEGLQAWKGGRRWKAVRTALTPPVRTNTMPTVVRMLPPPTTHVWKPQVGIESHPIYNEAILQHYQCPKTAQGEWMVQGGVLVTAVTPNSLYALAGGRVDDIVYGFQNSHTQAVLSPAGTWYSDIRDLPLSLVDLCNDTPVNENITMFVLRNDDTQRMLQLTFAHRQPASHELAHIRQIYPYCKDGHILSKEKAQVGGIVFAPLRANHVGAFRLMEYKLPSSHHQFKVVIEGVSPESPAYATGAVHAGSVVTKINDQVAADSWEGVKQQLSKPHPKTGCWVLDTAYQGQTSKFVMVTRNTITK
jgi:S1-C subfamily serine protease